MSNEELAPLVAAGDDAAARQLWGQIEKFVSREAARYKKLHAEGCRCDLYDLIDSGYLAMLEAAGRYDPDDGALFLTLFGWYLRRQFAIETAQFGPHGRRVRVPNGGAAFARYSNFSKPDSLDRQMDDGDADSAPFYSRVEDVGQLETLGALEDRIYTEQLHAELERHIDKLPEAEAAVIRETYWSGRSFTEQAKTAGRSFQRVSQLHQQGVKRLQHYAAIDRERALASYLDSMVDCYTRSAESAAIRREELRERKTRRCPR